jgi:hypothetical protein
MKADKNRCQDESNFSKGCYHQNGFWKYFENNKIVPLFKIDKDGFPIEFIDGKGFRIRLKNFLRLIFMNIRKII